MRNHTIDELTRLAETDKRIVLLSGDLGYHVLDNFASRYPERYFNAGIAEQNMASVAAGLALEGLVPCMYSTGCFPTLRCIEQIRNSICYHNANVKIIAVGGGFIYGQLGMSHHATEEIAALRALPNMTVFSPADPDEAVSVIRTAMAHDGPCYIRLGRGGEQSLHVGLMEDDVRKIQLFRSNGRICIMATGSILTEVLKAADILASEGIDVKVCNCITLKPIDREGIALTADSVDAIVTVEEHNVIGGLGSAVADILCARGGRIPRLIKLGLQDEYTSIVGSSAYLRDQYGVSADRIAATVRALPAALTV